MSTNHTNIRCRLYVGGTFFRFNHLFFRSLILFSLYRNLNSIHIDNWHSMTVSASDHFVISNYVSVWDLVDWALVTFWRARIFAGTCIVVVIIHQGCFIKLLRLSDDHFVSFALINREILDEKKNSQRICETNKRHQVIPCIPVSLDADHNLASNNGTSFILIFYDRDWFGI